MTENLKRQQASRENNNQKLWNVLSAYADDSDGVTKYEAIELAEFVVEPGRTQEEIFHRALNYCKKKAESEGMFIPRATSVGKRGYAYVLAKSGATALDGYMAQSRVATGVRRSESRHELFIDRNRDSVPPVLRTVFDEVKKSNDRFAEFLEESKKVQFDQLEAVFAAYVEENGVSKGN